MSPLARACHKVKTLRTRAYALFPTVSSGVAIVIILTILAVLTVSQAYTPHEPTSTSVGHAALVQTPTPRRRLGVTQRLPRRPSCSIPACPDGPVSEGTEVTLTAQSSGSNPARKTEYRWLVKSGKIINGENDQTMTLSTAGAGGKTVSATVNISGGCSRKCSFRVKVPKVDIFVPPPSPPDSPTPRPTHTVTPARPTLTDTSTPSPRPTHTVTPAPTTPSPTVTVTPPTEPSPTSTTSPLSSGGVVGTPTSPGSSPSESPSTPFETPQATPTLEGYAGIITSWPWILAIVIALAAGAAFAIGQLRQRGSIFSRGHAGSTATSIERSEVENDLTAVILAANKKREEEVRCTVFAPYEAAPGDAFLVHAFAHLADQAHLLSEIAKQAQRDTTQRGSATLAEVARGEKLGFELEMPGLEIDEPSQTLVWLGKTALLQFGVTVPETFKPPSINCKLSVSRHGVPMGHIKFNFKFSAEPQLATEPTLNSHPNFVAYKLAFISYASADRSEVMKRVQMLDSANIRYFQDLLSLEAGKEWEPVIYRYIDECDVFFLFWSTAAKKSKWVRKEVERALKRRADKFDAPPDIMGIPIEGPPAVEPPRYLKSIHFDTKFLYFINPRDGGS